MPEKEQRRHENMDRLLKIALVAAIMALLVLALLLFAQYRGLEEQHLVGGHASLLTSLRRNGTLEPQDAALIQSWMTFDYVDYIFSLPTPYLQTSLSISDPRYPHLAIEDYAEGAHLSPAATLAAVQAAVRSYEPASQPAQ
jgi:hypothetical protein